MEPQGSELSHPSTQRVRVAIDARKCGDGGIGVYITNLVRGLLEVGGSDITLIASEGARAESGFASDVSWIKDNAAHYSLDEMLFMGRRLKLAGYDLFHAPHYVLPFGITIPTVVTIHDLIHIEHPEKFYYPMIAKPLIRSAVRRAGAVIAVSRQTQRALLNLCSVPEPKVTYVPNAVAAYLRDAPIGDAALAKCSNRGPFLLSVFSTVKPHKGLHDLIVAYRRFRGSGAWKGIGSECPNLILAGYGTEMLLEKPDLLSSLGNLDGVTVVGAISEEELAALYRNATLLVVPSLLEGFCLPALEAQACGTPVVCRPVPALKELVTESDLVAGDFSIEALTAAIAEGITRSVGAKKVVPTQHLELYSCKRTASSVLDIYRRVSGLKRTT